jgi:hypothetical protein
MSTPSGLVTHKSFHHDTFESLGYDWERIADPDIEPKHPFKLYLPRTTGDIVRAVLESKALGERPRIRSRGHSSNDLVLEEGGSVICTMLLDRVLNLDSSGMSVTVQSGVVLATLDGYLARRGLGLPVVGDHNDITAGGFASVGGISPASHRYGLFVDNVLALEYVDWDGELVRCNESTNREEFYRALTGMGQHGVIATLKLRIIRVDKYHRMLRNDRALYRDEEHFIEHANRVLNEPPDAPLVRCMWFDFGKGLEIGQVSEYKETPQEWGKKVRGTAAFGLMHLLGKGTSSLPGSPALVTKALGALGVALAPIYGTAKDVETAADRVLDPTVGDPTRMFVLIAPCDRFPFFFRGLYRIAADYKRRYGCFSYITLTMKCIRSSYLTRGKLDRLYCEMILLVGIKLGKFPTDLMERMVEQIDDLCIERGAFRYMHTRTTKDPDKRRKIDPNALYAPQQTNPVPSSATAYAG